MNKKKDGIYMFFTLRIRARTYLYLLSPYTILQQNTPLLKYAYTKYKYKIMIENCTTTSTPKICTIMPEYH